VDEPRRVANRYLEDVSVRLTGPRRTRQRLLAEIRDHLDDALAANLGAGMSPADAAEHAARRLGPPAAVADAWQARCSRLRTHQRRRAAILIAAAAAAAVLAAAQHAQGRRDPLTQPPRAQPEKSRTPRTTTVPGPAGTAPELNSRRSQAPTAVSEFTALGFGTVGDDVDRLWRASGARPRG
jgi:hypothetical protein